MNGLTDANLTIATNVRIFLQDHWLKKFTVTQERIQFLLEKALTPTSQGSFINVFCDLTLSYTEASPTLKKDLFDQPLANLMQFRKIDINTYWRSQFGADVAAPMFAETLASTQNPTSGSGELDSPRILATQTTLEFTPTQGALSSSSLARTKQFMSSLVPNTLTSFETGQFKISAQDKSFGQQLMRLPQEHPETVPQTVTEGGGVKIGRR